MLFIVCAVIFWGKIIVLWTKIAKNWENVINYVISSIKSNINENTFKFYWKNLYNYAIKFLGEKVIF